MLPYKCVRPCHQEDHDQKQGGGIFDQVEYNRANDNATNGPDQPVCVSFFCEAVRRFKDNQYGKQNPVSMSKGKEFGDDVP